MGNKGGGSREMAVDDEPVYMHAPSSGRSEGRRKQANYKIILVGRMGVGKTSLASRLCKDEYYEGDSLMTLGIDFMTSALRIGDTDVRLQVWDAAGQERFEAVVTSYFNGANGALLCFDLTDEDSFLRLDFWMDRLRNSRGRPPILLVGCKADDLAGRVIPRERAEAWVEEHVDQRVIGYIETSAKAASNVTACFTVLTTHILEREEEEYRSMIASAVDSRGASPDEIGRSSIALTDRDRSPHARRKGGWCCSW